MAVLAKIRKRSALLIIAIAVALFAFVAQDLFTKTGLGKNTRNVGTIDGKNISYEEFSMKLSNAGKSDANTTNFEMADRLWNQEVSKCLLASEFDKLNLMVSSDQIMESLKQDESIVGNPEFLDQNGKFDPIKFKKAIESNPNLASFLRSREKDAEMNAKAFVYGNLLKAGLYTTTSEGKFKYEMENNKANFSYVTASFSSINDKTITISDDEIKDFMKKNEKEYKSDETREIQYVTIPIKPSLEDENDVKSKIEKLLTSSVVYNDKTGKNDTLAGFKNTKNIVSFVNENSDIPFDSTYVSKNKLPATDAENLFNLATGAIYGPYKKENYYCYSKSLGTSQNGELNISQILISYKGAQFDYQKEPRTKEQAKKIADSLLKISKEQPNNFAMLAYMNSDDYSSAQQGGNVGDVNPGRVNKIFRDFLYKNTAGSIGLIETPQGFSLIKINDKKPGVKLATLGLRLEPSEATSDKLFNDATKFEMQASEKDLVSLAKEMNFIAPQTINVKPMDEALGSLGKQREVVKWIFSKETEQGDVKRFEITNIGHLILKVKSINKTGLISIADARLRIEPILRNKKKAEILKNKMNGQSLESIAKALGTTVVQVTDVNFQNPLLAGAYEPKVIGVAFALPTNKLSAPIDGNSGVFVIQPSVVTKSPALQNYDDYVQKIKKDNASEVNRVLPALKEIVKIVDNRSDFGY